MEGSGWPAQNRRSEPDQALGRPVGLRLQDARRLAPRVLDPSTFVCRILLGVKVLALPDISGHVAEHGGEVVVAAAAGCGSLP